MQNSETKKIYIKPVHGQLMEKMFEKQQENTAVNAFDREQ